MTSSPLSRRRSGNFPPAVLGFSVREPDDLGVLARGARGVARLAQLLLHLAQPRLGPAGDGDLAGADDLVNAEGPEQLDDRLDLRLLPRDLQRVSAGRDIDHLRAED